MDREYVPYEPLNGYRSTNNASNDTKEVIREFIPVEGFQGLKGANVPTESERRGKAERSNIDTDNKQK